MLHIQKLFFILFVGIALSQSSMAKTNTKIDKVIKTSIAGVTEVEAKQLILTKAQHAYDPKKSKSSSTYQDLPLL